MWNQIITVAIGIGLMAAPDVLDYESRPRLNDIIVGPLLVSFATCAIWEVLRGLRWVNTLLGAWLLAGPWLLGYALSQPGYLDMGCGLATIVLSVSSRRAKDRFGGGWTSLFHAATD